MAHPITQPYISDGDQLALSYLESVSVHKAAAVVAAAAASEKQAGAAEKTSPSKSAGENGGRDEPRAETEELDDDDDVGFRVTFVSGGIQAARKSRFFLFPVKSSSLRRALGTACYTGDDTRERPLLDRLLKL